jgi:hypothetical protein
MHTFSTPPAGNYLQAIARGVLEPAAAREAQMKPAHQTMYLFIAAAALTLPPGVSAQTAPAAVTAAAEAPAPLPAGVSATPAVLPTTKELLEKYQSASGGKEVWSSFQTRFMKGLYQTEDASGFAGIEILSKAPNKVFTKITFANGVIIREVCDGKSAWVEDFRGGMHELTGAALESRIRHASFNDRADGLLMAISGHVLGIEKVGARSAYTLEFSPEKRLTSKMYFDVDTGLMIREDDVIHRDDGDYHVQTLLDDYRLVDGAYFPFRIKHTEKGNVFTVKVTQIKHNVPVEETVFLKPESAKK